MTTSKSLPARPSLESLRKQAKKLARDIAAGDAGAIARARAQLPRVAMPLSQRNAQLVLAREYGFAGWQDLTAEVSKRLGNGLEWAAAQARRVIHDNDVERLKQLLAEYPALLSRHADDDDGGLLEMATSAYGDSFDPDRERIFTRAACAELLIDAGAVVSPSVCEGLIRDRASGLLQLFERKGLLPRTLEFRAALGDLDAVRASLDENGNDLAAVNDAFMIACRFEHEAVASLLLERSIALDPELGGHVDGSAGRLAFIKYLIEERSLAFVDATPAGPWQAFVMEQIMRAVQDGDLTAFVRGLQREPWLLGEACVGFQTGLIERATLRDRGDFIVALLDLDPALLRHQPPPRSQAIEFAVTYAKPHLIAVLTRIWPMPDDLPHAAAMGDLSRVKRWFDESGAPALGDLDNHYPYNDPRARGHLQWSTPTLQQVLDTALAFSVINRHFDVADFLLAHGADINTTWSSHEPASILHELVGQVATGENPDGNYDSMRFLIDRGIDMTIKDYRWNATAQGWARYAAKDEKMAQWLEDTERQRN
ncbi:MAG TPA: ankyrin repeat domain-containing protein [Vicinamibacterales bacterium]|nr:ankyrin repeat domain-containing protein [Vicinamibacterales bacterium]